MRIHVLGVTLIVLAALTPVGAPEADDVDERNRALFRSLWGDLWDPDAVGTVDRGDGPVVMTLAEAAQVFVARAAGIDRLAVVSGAADGTGPPDGTIAAGDFELLEMWLGDYWWPHPRNCNQGWGNGGHYDHVVTYHQPTVQSLGFGPLTGTAWSNMTQVPGYEGPPAAFIDHGATHASFLYEGRNVTYVGNSDFYCVEHGFFGLDLIINNPRVRGAVHFSTSD